MCTCIGSTHALCYKEVKCDVNKESERERKKKVLMRSMIVSLVYFISTSTNNRRRCKENEKKLIAPLVIHHLAPSFLNNILKRCPLVPKPSGQLPIR